MLETFNTHRKALFGIAYRMLGSVSEAEDMMQEVWLRWQRQDLASIGSPKAWFVSITTRLCIDQLRSARRKREAYYGVWLPEPLVEGQDNSQEAASGLADSLSIAFMLLLESLAPTERAVFLLREVFNYDYADTAAIVEKSEANCRQIIRRARVHLQTAPRNTQPPTPEAERLVDEFISAAESGEVKRLLSMLTADATVYSDGGGKIKAAGRPIHNADRVSRFFTGVWPRFPTGTVWQHANINSRPGFLLRVNNEVFGACSFDFTENLVSRVYMIVNPDKLRHLASESNESKG